MKYPVPSTQEEELYRGNGVSEYRGKTWNLKLETWNPNRRLASRVWSLVSRNQNAERRTQHAEEDQKLIYRRGETLKSFYRLPITDHRSL